jgi:hypothetical protein
MQQEVAQEPTEFVGYVVEFGGELLGGLRGIMLEIQE